MNCPEARRQLVDLVYESRPDQSQPALHAHLAACPACGSQWEQMRQGHTALSRLTEKSPDVRVDVTRVYRQAVDRANRARRRWRASAVASAAMAALVLLGVGLGLRVEAYRTHVVFSWGEPPAVVPPMPSPPPPPPFADPWPELKEQRDRLAGMNELLTLTAREVLALDGRQSAELVRLRREIRQLEAQADLRWRLIATELLSRPEAQLAEASPVRRGSDSLPPLRGEFPEISDDSRSSDLP